MRAWIWRAVLACMVTSGAQNMWAQIDNDNLIDLSLSSTYKIAGLTVLGAEHTDVQAIKLFSSLQVGQEITIPGDDIKRAITGLWAQDLFLKHLDQV